MFPKTNEYREIVSQDKDISGDVYSFDFEKKAYRIEDGNLVALTEPVEKVKQWLRFLIKAEFDHVEVYKASGFGLSLKKYIGKKSLPLGYVASEIKGQLKEKIKLNPLIKGVSKVEVNKNSKGHLMFSIWIIMSDGRQLEVNEIV